MKLKNAWRPICNELYDLQVEMSRLTRRFQHETLMSGASIYFPVFENIHGKQDSNEEEL